MSLFSKFTKNNHNEKTIYPWSQRKISGSNNALPRFGHAATMLDNQHFLVYGGIHNKGNPKKNLFIIDTNNISASSLSTSGDIPSLRSFATISSIGGFVLLYGGEPLIPSEIWDPYFYVLHTNTRQWSRVRTKGRLPSERAGHSTCISDGIMYIWGGHFQRKYLNDLCAFNVREYPSKAEWNFIPYENQGPSPRSGHVSVIYENKLYIFGGINARHLYNDIWYFDLTKRTWHQISAVGYIPTPRESCAAALVDDTIYIFGGKGLNGSSLGDLCAFRIKSQRWYMFQSMGPPPSPRFGLSLTVIQNKIYVFGGDSVGTKNEDSAHMFILDCSKIKYPPEPETSESETSNIDRVRNSTTTTSTSNSNVTKTELLHSSIETAEQKSPGSNMRLIVNHRQQPSDEAQKLNSPITENSLESNSSHPRQNSDHEHYTTVTPPPRPPREGAILNERYLQNTPTLDPQLKFKREMSQNHQLNPPRTIIDSLPDEKKVLMREISARDAIINEMRKKEQWWRTEVSIAKKQQNNYDDQDLESAFLMQFEPENDDKMLLFQELVTVKSEIKKIRNSIHKQTDPILQKIEQAERVRTIALEEAAYYKSKYIALKTKDKEALHLLESDRVQTIEKRLLHAFEQKKHIESSFQAILEKSQHDQAARLLAEERAKQAQFQSEEAQAAHQEALEQLTELYQKIIKTEAQGRVDVLTIANLSNELADLLSSTENTNHEHDISQIHIEMARLEAANIRSRNEIAVLLKQLEEGKDNEMSLKMLLNEKDEAYGEAVLELEKVCIELELLKGVMPNNSNSSHGLTTVK